MIHLQQREKARNIKLTCSDLAVKLQTSERTIYRYFDGSHKAFDSVRKIALKECIEQAIKRREWEINKSKQRKVWEMKREK